MYQKVRNFAALLFSCLHNEWSAWWLLVWLVLWCRWTYFWIVPVLRIL